MDSRQSPPDAQGHIWIQYWVERLPHDLVLDSFGLRFEQLENLRQYLRNGYFSWDGSCYVQPDTLAEFEGVDPELKRGYGMCQLLPRYGSGNLILGFDRHDRFQQTFTFDTSHQPLSLTIQTWWDRKDRSGLERCESERLVIFNHTEIENGLREWAGDCGERLTYITAAFFPFDHRLVFLVQPVCLHQRREHSRTSPRRANSCCARKPVHPRVPDRRWIHA